MQMLSFLPSALSLELVLRLVGFIVKKNMFFPTIQHIVIHGELSAHINRLINQAYRWLEYLDVFYQWNPTYSCSHQRLYHCGLSAE